MLNVGKKMWPISALLGELVGVAGFEPAIPSSRTRERGVRVEAKSLFRFKASVSARTLRKYLIQPNMGHLPGPPRSPAQTEISQFNANRPQFGGDLCTHFISAICRLDCRDRFEVFVSALENSVSRRRELALVETRFECWVSATESQACHAALTIRVILHRAHVAERGVESARVVDLIDEAWKVSCNVI